LIRDLGDKYRYLRHNTRIYENYPFNIGQIREPSNQCDENGRLKPPHLNRFGFSGPGESLIIDMLLRFQDETHYVYVETDLAFSIWGLVVFLVIVDDVILLGVILAESPVVELMPLTLS
jgi:hypothetical protein